MADNLLLRGSRIKNTEWAIGCAVYTGQSTKLSLNSRLTRNKMSSSEAYVNKYLVFFLVLLIAMVIVSYFSKNYFDQFAWEHNLYLGNPVVRSPVGTFLQDFFSYLILFNYLIPISLYVTIEFHKFFGAFFMEWDPALYDADTNQPLIVNTSDLNEELGQVKYLFSDKTGTLTKNEMILQQCSIRGRMYTMTGSGIQEKNHINAMKISEFRDEHMTFFLTLATCHTVQVAGDMDNEIIPDSYGNGNANQNATTDDDVAEGDVNAIRDNTHLVPRESVNNNNIVPRVVVRNLSNDQISNIAEESTPSPTTRTSTNDHLIVDSETVTSSIGNKSVAIGLPEEEAIFRSRLQLLIPDAQVMNNMDNNNVTSPRVVCRPSQLSPAQMMRSRTKLQRPLSTMYGTTTTDKESAKQQTHRRTQSYVAPTSHSRQTQADGVGRRHSKSNSLTRFAGFGSGNNDSASGSVVNLREYYAAASFNQSTLLERKESLLRRNEIRTAVE